MQTEAQEKSSRDPIGKNVTAITRIRVAFKGRTEQTGNELHRGAIIRALIDPAVRG